MLFTPQFWDFISVFVYTFVVMLGILAFIVDMLILWCLWELFREWFCKKSWFKKKGHAHD